MLAKSYSLNSPRPPGSIVRPRFFETDSNMHQLYPPHIGQLAAQHWTPLSITKMAVAFLAPKSGVRILDIGSGVGKFVLAGAYLKPQAAFFGVEQRAHLVGYAEAARRKLGLDNAHFFPCNMADLHFHQFDHFYFYNSFYENLCDTQHIDQTVKYSPALYCFYARMLYRKLAELPRSTRLVTFHYLEGRLPPSFRLVEEEEGSLLKFWIKQ